MELGNKSLKEKGMDKKVSRTIQHNIMFSAISITQLNHAKETQSGYQFKYILPSLAFSVFRLEVMCNTVGQDIYKDSIHNNIFTSEKMSMSKFKELSLKDKVSTISIDLFSPDVPCPSSDCKYDQNKRPWSVCLEMIEFRNKLVHSKPINITSNVSVPDESPELIANLIAKQKAYQEYSDKGGAFGDLHNFVTIERAELFMNELDYIERIWEAGAREKEITLSMFTNIDVG